MFCANPNTDPDSVKRQSCLLMNTQTAGSSCLPAMVEQCELRVLALQGTAYTPKHGKQKKKKKIEEERIEKKRKRQRKLP